jgi:hypothetical protein
VPPSETHSSDAPGSTEASSAPERQALVLLALILVAGVANLNLSVANVARPEIGKHFDSSQATLDLIAVGYSLGLAASVLYLGAPGTRRRRNCSGGTRPRTQPRGRSRTGVCRRLPRVET